jgi:ArsR family transcriptional regulator, arsenate/arsenite/antimonite-responsive transcriptional repressor
MDDGKLVRVLKALADPKRFRMVQEIAAAGELSCGRLGDKFDLSQPTVSHHIKILSEAGVLAMRREAQHGFVSVNQKLLDEVLGLLPRRLRGRR